MKALKTLFSLLFLGTFVQFTIAQSFTKALEPVDPSLEGVRSCAIAFSDFDNDGDQDLFVTGRNANSEAVLTAYINNGEGGYTAFSGDDFGLLRSAVAFADVDSDGFEDFMLTGLDAVSGGNAGTYLFLNEGDGSGFDLSSGPFEAGVDGSIAFADVDGDNDRDVLITGSLKSILYINDGMGDFIQDTLNSFVGVTLSASDFADVDGDGDQDVLIAGRSQDFGGVVRSTILYTNDGSGVFTQKQNTPFPDFDEGTVDFADIDGDGDPDLLLTGFIDDIGTERTILYTNDGSGNFTEKMGTPFGQVSFSAVAFADVDNDGDLDVLITGNGPQGMFSRISTLYTNDGSGNFTEKAGNSFDGVIDGSAAFADVDGDGDQDVVIAGAVTSAETPSLQQYVNDGQGNFAKQPRASFTGVRSCATAVADVDGDGDQDIVVTGRTSNDGTTASLYVNDGAGSFRAMGITDFEGIYRSAVAFADVDGDGDQDAIMSGRTAVTGGNLLTELFINEGQGEYGSSSGNFEPVDDGSISFADVDGDGDQDVLITGSLKSILYINGGMGDFTQDTNNSFVGVTLSASDFADVDGDGDQDVLIIGRSQDFGGVVRSTILYTNDGSGVFTQKQNTPFPDFDEGTVDFADIDGDGDPDLLLTGFIGSNTERTILYTNDGSGNFTEKMGTPFGQVSFSAVAFADVDNDGDLDVLITGNGPQGMFSRISTLYANDGSGNFTEVMNTPFDGVIDGSVSFGDFDGDGDQDVVIAGAATSAETPTACLYLNNTIVSTTTIAGLEVAVFPNPTAGFVQIKGINPDIVFVTDAMGRVVKQQRNGNRQVDLSQLPAGVYFLEIGKDMQWATLKIIKE